MWVKLANPQSTLMGFFLGWGDANNYGTMYLNNDDHIYYKEKNGGTQYEEQIDARKFRDHNAWYHFFIQWDYTQSTATNRLKIYVNNELMTWVNSGSNLPPQNYSTRLKKNDFRIGTYTHAGSSYYDWKGLMSHVHFIDDAPYDTYTPSTFGETDSTTGEWKIKTSPTISDYGYEGFFILKDDNLGTDRSGKGNNFSTSGTITKTEDCPSNIFATLNPLIPATSGTPTFGKGNTTYKSTASSWDSGLSTIMPSSGKWYFEVKPMDNDNTMIGLVDIQRNPEFASGTSTYGYLGYKGMSYQAYSNGTAVVYRDNSNAHTGLTGWSAGDICGVAIDLDNQEMFLHINGTYTNSGNPATRANPYDFSTVVNSGNNVAMGVSSRNNYVTYVNFGNGYFHTTAVSSAGTNASGNGIFEYDVPTGYTALSTKGLNE
jgi:hypothetical protein